MDSDKFIVIGNLIVSGEQHFLHAAGHLLVARRRVKQSQPMAMRAGYYRSCLHPDSRRTDVRSRLRKFPVMRDDNKRRRTTPYRNTGVFKCSPEQIRPSVFQPCRQSSAHGLQPLPVLSRNLGERHIPRVHDNIRQSW
jgi:hypothetical protein